MKNLQKMLCLGIVFYAAFHFNGASGPFLEAKPAYADLPCAMCQWILQETDKYLTSESTELEIEVALGKVCSYLPPTLQPMCNDYIVTNETGFISGILNKTPDMEICQALETCPMKIIPQKCESLSCEIQGPELPAQTADPNSDPLTKKAASMAQAPEKTVPSEAGTPVFLERHFIIYEQSRQLLSIVTDTANATVMEGVLRYNGSYSYYLFDLSTTGQLMNLYEFNLFTTPKKPENQDLYGNPLIGQGLKDQQGQDIALLDNKLETLVSASAGLLSQHDRLAALLEAGGILRDQSGGTLAHMNTDDLRVVLSGGGKGKAVVMAASESRMLRSIQPLTARGYSVNENGVFRQDTAIYPKGIRLPLGIFNFTISLGENADNCTVAVIPPAPFAPDTKWYEVLADGTIKADPNFVVDSMGSGLLTVNDNDERDRNPALGVIRYMGGPGATSGCFIATAAYGSGFHPFVNILRAFRDEILTASAPGRDFVQWYYRVSPPMAEVIAEHGFLQEVIRIALFPAVGLAWMCLQVGVVPAGFILLVVCGFLILAGRAVRKKAVLR